MAERERFRADRRAVALGVRNGIVGAALCAAFLGAVGLGVGPFVRLVAGALPIPLPGLRFLVVTSALVGVLVGGAGVRGNRRITRGAESRLYEPGASALDRYLDSLGTDLGGQGPTEPRAVREWSPGLLARSDLRPVAEGLSDGPR